ncbi:putative calmodulin [Trypanosoma theileri]|uniref:Putative calmodulin n=1 Tax=Trypanosoma theileri TaxID=67003 RepID=A0A1X0P5X0_9TRYP|nr:putative calmodulin [Trypanosoma theileri]ORC92336.1 putative calmodulin [Trypanosoma theileri]
MRYAVESYRLSCTHLSSEDLRFLRDSFIRLDTDGDGLVGLQDLHSIFGEEILGMCVESDMTFDLESYLQHFSKYIDAVKRLVTPVRIELSDDEILLLESSFENIDLNNDGFIDEEELCNALMECLGDCGDGTSTLWLTGVIMSQADRDADGRISFSEFILALQEDNGVFPQQLITLPLSYRETRSQLKVSKNGSSNAAMIPFHQCFSPYEVFLMLCAIDVMASENPIVSVRQFSALLLEEFQRSCDLLHYTLKELVLHLSRRSLLLAPYIFSIGSIDCKRFSEIVVADPNKMLLTVPSILCRLESSMRSLTNFPYDVGQRLILLLLELNPECVEVWQLEELPQRLKNVFPELNETELWTIIRSCTTAAEVAYNQGFSLQRLVRRLTIRYSILPRDYTGKTWRRLGPLERSQIRSNLLHTDIESWYSMTSEEVRELIMRDLLKSDVFWDQEHVALLVASCVESMVFSQKLSPNELRVIMAQEMWPPSGNMMDEPSRMKIATKMTELNLGCEGLHVVRNTICQLDTFGTGIIDEELLLPTLYNVIKELKSQWENVQIDRAVCDAVLACEAMEDGQSVNCSELLKYLLPN